MEGQITERFTRAIDQLGNDKGQLDVTLGGIYALQRIAKDSRDDRATIAEILSAYVRSRAPWPPRVPGQLPWRKLLSWLPRGPGRLPEDTPLAQLPSLQERCPDVQAALTVLGHIPSGDHGRLNLQRTDLRWADLVDADLEGAPSLIVTQFKGRPRLLQRTDLRRADPMDADLEEAPSLTTVHFGLPGPEGPDLAYAHLEGARLMGARLKGARLISAHLERADLTLAHLEVAILTGAHLEGAILTGAHLEGVDLRETVGLAQVQLDATRGNAWTRLPAGVQRPTSWPAEEDSTASR